MNDIFSLEKDPFNLFSHFIWKYIKISSSYAILYNNNSSYIIDLCSFDNYNKKFRISDILYNKISNNGKIIFMVCNDGGLLLYTIETNDIINVKCPYIEYFFQNIPKCCGLINKSVYNCLYSTVSDFGDYIMFISNDFKMYFGIQPFEKDNWISIFLPSPSESTLDNYINEYIYDIVVLFPVGENEILYIYCMSTTDYYNVQLIVWTFEIDSTMNIVDPLHIYHKTFQFSQLINIKSLHFSVHPVKHDIIFSINSQNNSIIGNYSFDLLHLYTKMIKIDDTDEIVQLEWVDEGFYFFTLTKSGKLQVYSAVLSSYPMIHNNNINKYQQSQDEFVIQLSNRESKKLRVVYFTLFSFIQFVITTIKFIIQMVIIYGLLIVQINYLHMIVYYT